MARVLRVTGGAVYGIRGVGSESTLRNLFNGHQFENAGWQCFPLNFPDFEVFEIFAASLRTAHVGYQNLGFSSACRLPAHFHLSGTATGCPHSIPQHPTLNQPEALSPLGKDSHQMDQPAERNRSHRSASNQPWTTSSPDRLPRTVVSALPLHFPVHHGDAHVVRVVIGSDPSFPPLNRQSFVAHAMSFGSAL